MSGLREVMNQVSALQDEINRLNLVNADLLAACEAALVHFAPGALADPEDEAFAIDMIRVAIEKARG